MENELKRRGVVQQPDPESNRQIINLQRQIDTLQANNLSLHKLLKDQPVPAPPPPDLRPELDRANERIFRLQVDLQNVRSRPDYETRYQKTSRNHRQELLKSGNYKKKYKDYETN